MSLILFKLLLLYNKLLSVKFDWLGYYNICFIINRLYVIFDSVMLVYTSIQWIYGFYFFNWILAFASMTNLKMMAVMLDLFRHLPEKSFLHILLDTGIRQYDEPENDGRHAGLVPASSK